MRDLGDFIRDQRRNARLSLRKLSEVGRHLESVPQPDRAGPAQAVGRDPPGIAQALRISAETLYVRAGILDERADAAPDLVAAVLRRPDLSERQKQVLMEIYRSFQTETRAGEELASGA